MRVLRLGLTSVAIATIFGLFAPSIQAAKKPQPYNPVPPGWPQVLTIPRFRVIAPVEHVPFTHRNDYTAPFRWGDVAWYDLGPRPGDFGHSAILGHLDSYCCPAVFYHLRDIHKGDHISVKYPNGKSLWFRVMWTAVYPNAKVPVRFLFGPGKTRALVLLTCTGVFHRNGGGYDHKYVAYARLILPNGQLG